MRPKYSKENNEDQNGKAIEILMHILVKDIFAKFKNTFKKNYQRDREQFKNL